MAGWVSVASVSYLQPRFMVLWTWAMESKNGSSCYSTCSASGLHGDLCHGHCPRLYFHRVSEQKASLSTCSNWLKNLQLWVSEKQSLPAIVLIWCLSTRFDYATPCSKRWLWGLYIFATFCLLSSIYTLYFAPKTRGCTLEKMDHIFKDVSSEAEQAQKKRYWKQNCKGHRSDRRWRTTSRKQITQGLTPQFSEPRHCVADQGLLRLRISAVFCHIWKASFQKGHRQYVVRKARFRRKNFDEILSSYMTVGEIQVAVKIADWPIKGEFNAEIRNSCN